MFTKLIVILKASLVLVFFATAAQAAGAHYVPVPTSKLSLLSVYTVKYDDDCAKGIQCVKLVDDKNREVAKLPLAEAGHVFVGRTLIVNPYNPLIAKPNVIDRTTYRYKWTGQEFVLIDEQPWPAKKVDTSTRTRAIPEAQKNWLDKQAAAAWDKIN